MRFGEALIAEGVSVGREELGDDGGDTGGKERAEGERVMLVSLARGRCVSGRCSFGG